MFEEHENMQIIEAKVSSVKHNLLKYRETLEGFYLTLAVSKIGEIHDLATRRLASLNSQLDQMAEDDNQKSRMESMISVIDRANTLIHGPLTVESGIND